MKLIRPFILALLLITPALAQEPAPVPATVEAPAAPAPDETLQADDVQGPVVMELFSSQACVFCPKADTLLGDLSSVNNIIALTCHVDYYDVAQGSLSRPFCSTRQSAYASSLRSGPIYTPQMVINGAYDVVGYHLDDISKILRKASRPGLLTIDITKVSEPSRYRISLPTIAVDVPKVATKETTAATDTGIYDLWIAFVDKPHVLTIADGGNKGTAMKYYDVVSDLLPLGKWNGQQKVMLVDLKTTPLNQAFVVLAQKPGGEIFAVGRQSLIAMPAKLDSFGPQNN